MPELPEVQTTVDDVRRLKGLRIVDVWTDYFSSLYENHKQIKNKKFFNHFKKRVVGRKIVGAKRRAKNVLIELDSGDTVLVHMKMTGHLLYGKYEKKKENKKTFWRALGKGPLRDDSFNQFIHLVFSLSNGKHLVLSDVRKFAKVTIFSKMELEEEFKKFGPEPLDKNFTPKILERMLKLKPNGKIKQVLMDQSVVSGIGNIYSDEILWASGINPLRKALSLSKSEIGKIYKNTRIILKKGINFGGDSLSDYRQLDGKRGRFQHEHRAYRETGKTCSKKGCGGKIMRMMIGGRSTHFCNKHQK